MTPLFKKLNFKNHEAIFALNTPQSFDAELAAMQEFTTIQRTIVPQSKVSFAIIFATKQSEVDDFAELVCPKLEADAVLWFAYPKGTSKKYKCDFNRDTGWHKLGDYDLEGVRMVAIDEDWSGLRFRQIDFIKTFSRSESLAISPEGKKRIASPDKK